MSERMMEYYDKVKKETKAASKPQTDSKDTADRNKKYKYDIDQINKELRERTSRVE